MRPFGKAVVSTDAIRRIAMNPTRANFWRCVECNGRFPAKPRDGGDGFVRCAQCPDCGSEVTCWESE